jgi:ABC-2 type transport system ATP-binding protein
MDKSIILNGISKSYGELEALAGIDLRIETGERFGLIGPDGAGKTSLMRILCGLIRPDEGEFSLAGLDGRRRMREIKNFIGYMPQRFSLYPDLTVAENLRFFADLFGVKGKERREHEERLLKFSRLGPFVKRRAAALSGGMKQKLALSCALIHTPEILILDEPTTGVDPVSRREFWTILSEISEKDGTTILVSTPYMDEAARCHRVALMNKGSILAMGFPDAVASKYPHAVLEIRGDRLPLNAPAIRSITGILSVRAMGDRIRVAAERTVKPEEPLKKAIAELGGKNITIENVNPTLEDMFVYLLEGDASDGGQQPRR